MIFLAFFSKSVSVLPKSWPIISCF